jgi:hypothetical protein
LAHIAIEMEDQVRDAVGCGVGPAPDLLFGQRLDAGAEAGPIVLKELVAGELEE